MTTRSPRRWGGRIGRRMHGDSRWGLPRTVALGAIAAVAVAATALAAALPPEPGAQPSSPPSGAAGASASAGLSDRSIEVLRFDCASRLGRREVTLFGNGTIRLRDGPIGREWMGLAELGPDELQGTLRRLGEEDLSEASHLPQGVVGEWIEKCDLVLALPGRKREKFFYGRYDTLPLGLYRVQRVAEELAAKVTLLRDVEKLPEHFEPRLGDVLKRTDGMRYRVVNFTSDHKGVELDGLDQPLHLIVLKEQMPLEFVGIVSRER